MAAATGVPAHKLRPDIYPLSLLMEEPDYTEECSAVVLTQLDPVTCDQNAKTQRKDVA